MTAETRFLFETTFDDPTAYEAEEAKVAEAQSEVEEAPTYSEEELNAACQEARAAGREEGVREAADATEHQMAAALTIIGERLSEIFDTQAKSGAAAAQDAATIAITIARKIFPDLNRRNLLGEIGRLVEMILAAVMDEPRLTIHVNDSLRDALTARIEELRHAKGFEGKIVLLGEPNIPPGDCRIEWSEGGTERNTAALWQQIDEIVENNIGTLNDAIEGVKEADGAAAPDAEEIPNPVNADGLEAESLEEDFEKIIEHDADLVEQDDMGAAGAQAPLEGENGLGASETPPDAAGPSTVEGPEDAGNKNIEFTDDEVSGETPTAEAETLPNGSSSNSDTS